MQKHSLAPISRRIAAQAWDISDLRPLIPVNTGTLPITHACLAVKPANNRGWEPIHEHNQQYRL